MSQTPQPQQQGTTLEVFQHYLAAGIDVQGPHAQGRLVELSLRNNWLVIEEPRPGRPCEWFFSPSHCKPILRPFSALCEPLEDGTVPAVEVAKLALGGEANEIDWAEVEARPTNADSTQAIDIVDTSDGLYHWVLVSISNTFDTDCDGNFTVNHATVTDYLRSQHFALPVNGRPLLEGVDFIAKSSARPTKEKGGKP